MSYGFYIKKLVVKGFQCKDASLEFKKNACVIVGPSNTGKSYVFQCIKYLLGSSKLPKKIKESAGYSNAYLEICLPNDDIKTIYRSLLGGHALLYDCQIKDVDSYSGETETLLVGTKATQKSRTLSDYLNSLCGFFDKQVRKNASGVTENIGFSLMRQISVIDEVSIIKEESPVLSGQVIYDTKEKSFLKFILTNVDDASIIAKPKANVIHNRKGKLEVLEAFIQEYKSELEEYTDVECTEEELLKQIEKLDVSICESNDELSNLFEMAKNIETTIDSHWQGWKKHESRLITVDELLVRFNLLAKHYDSDVTRLEAVNEAGKAFTELQIANCPVCKTELNNSDHNCNVDDIESVVTASETEIFKIQLLEKDLQFNINNLYNERNDLLEGIKENKLKHELSQRSVNEYRSIKIKESVASLEVFRLKLRELNRTKKLVVKINDLEVERDTYKVEIDPGDGNYDFETLSNSLMTGICAQVKTLLENWQYDEMQTVSFSEEIVDLVINGNERKLSGKGYRALAYSAFIIGIQQFCKANKRPHSGVVVLDSPLCTLRSRHIEQSESYEQDDIISDVVKDAFYENISTFANEGQVIVLENDGPNALVAKKLNYHEFTKDKNRGRYGFFPLS